MATEKNLIKRINDFNLYVINKLGIQLSYIGLKKYLNPKLYFYAILRFIIIFVRLITFHYFITLITRGDKIVSIIRKGISVFIFKGKKPLVYKRKYKLYSLLKVNEIKSEQIIFPEYKKLLVSIIIPIYNKTAYVFNCLKAIMNNTSKSLSYEVIVIENQSSDKTEELLTKIKDLKYYKNANNLRYIQSCNQGATIAKGKYICFLNNNTQVQKDWLTEMINVFKYDKDTGAVGSKIIDKNGNLLEAGCIIWKQANGANWGILSNPVFPEYSYLREVDYCSSTSLLIKKEDFKKAGQFDKQFSSTYYKDVDLCFKIRHKLGKKVYFQPKSEVIHFEGITFGSKLNSKVKQFQAVNHKKFLDKWQSELSQDYYDEEKYLYHSSIKRMGNKVIFVIDSFLPKYNRESGSNRLMHILKILKESAFHVIFLPDDLDPVEPYLSHLQRLGVEVLYKCYKGPTILKQLINRLPFIDFVWICRPELNRKFQKIFRKNSNIKIIYDTIDLQYLRLKTEFKLGLSDNQYLWKESYKNEIQMAAGADVVITVTAEEGEILKQQVDTHCFVIPNIHEQKSVEKDFNNRNGLIFIGGYDHRPNIDAANWLLNEIMPLVWNKNPEVRLYLLGSDPPDSMKKANSDRVIVPGFVDDVSDFFKKGKLFICPLRYGSGMKGKIGQSLEYRLPIISTRIGVQGMDLKENKHFLLAETTQQFVKQIGILYNNQNKWEKLFDNSHSAILKFSPAYIKKLIKDMFEKIQMVP